MGHGDLVRQISFEGNGGLSSGQDDYSLLSQMESGETGPRMMTWPFSVLATPNWFDEESFERDVARLEVFYAQHGWFNARVLGFEMRRVALRSADKAGVVDIVGKIDPGPRSSVKEIAVTGADGFTPDESVTFDEMWRHADVFVGDPFVLAYSMLTQRSIQSQLRENSFAYATVDVSVQATPEEQAVTLSYAVEPGIRARFGEVRISGNRDVSTAAILDTLDFESGDAYSLSAVGTSLNGLFDLSTFQLCL
jgi:outer membrane protein assembly factor BamA